jgi:hypothetical protein
MFEEDYERQRQQSEQETQNFLKQLESTQLMYSDFLKTNLYQEKQMKSRETLECLLALQFYTSKAIVKVYKTFNSGLADLYDKLKRMTDDF